MTNEQMQTIYSKQLELNDRVLRERFGINILELDEDQRQSWLLNYCRATIHELYELKHSVCNEDKHNIVVESVDIIHFVVSIGQVLGFTEYDYCIESYDDEKTSWLEIIMEDMDACVQDLVNMEDCVRWKWWGSKTPNWDSAGRYFSRLVDSLNNLFSHLGITDDQLYDVYCQKNAINHQRQDNGYNLDTKTEDDNLSIKIGGTD